MIPPSRIRVADVGRIGLRGLRAHPLRAGLSALGIAIGIAAMLAVVGVSASSQARVQQQLASLGTNLLVVAPGDDLFGQEAALPPEAPGRVRRLPEVERASWIGVLDGLHVYRNDRIDLGATGFLRVAAAGEDLLATTGTPLAAGRWFSVASEGTDAVVLGAAAAEQLGVHRAGLMVRVGDRPMMVVGILGRSALAPELDATVLVAAVRATEVFGFDGSPTSVHVRVAEDDVAGARALLAASVNPLAPHEVQVSRPSDALAAKSSVDQAFTGLLIGIGSIALLVGGIGVANTMVITVLERRREIGLRRSLGATRGHVRVQFLVEAVQLALLGGVGGTVLGVVVTAAIATVNGWLVTIPAVAPLGGLVLPVVVGAVAGVLPAMRAARTPPTAALSL